MNGSSKAKGLLPGIPIHIGQRRTDVSSVRLIDYNEVLTVISTVFIPLTLIAGIYGMTFFNMPELTWAYGYSVVLIIMFVLGVSMLTYFRRIDWI